MNIRVSDIEPTFANAITTIMATVELPLQTRRQWCSALRGVARCFDQPLEVIPARFSAIRARLASLHHVPVEWTAKTMANTKSNAKAALLWFCKEQGQSRDGVPLSAEWRCLHSQLSDRSTRYRLAPFMRFCSALAIEPGAVDEGILDRFLAHREITSSRRSDKATRRIIAKLWNSCVGQVSGWPSIRVAVPPPMRKGGLAFEDFPTGWQADVSSYLDGLKRIRRLPNGGRRQPCAGSTIVTRKRELVAAANMAVKSGMPIASLTNLAAMLKPDVANSIIDAYWKQNGDVPTTSTINLACRFVSIARQVTGIDVETIEKLGDLRYALEQYRDEGMTEKNLAVIRQVLTPGVWERIVQLPERLLRQARALQQRRPIQAGLLAQIAVSVAILTVAPVRLGNLSAIRLGENLIKPGGPDSNYWLVFPKYDVKNKRKLNFALDDVVTGIINEYVFDFRPAMMRGNNDDWLFPGLKGDHKEKISFSTQIVKQVERSSGMRVTVHQFRHAAGALILRHRPGAFELVRDLLGHKSTETTRRFYIDLDTTMASEIFTKIVRNRISFDDEDAADRPEGVL